VPQELDILTVDEAASTFVLRLEVEARDRTSAQSEALAVATGALASAGYGEGDVHTGAPMVTAIDVG
jgi:hypothetical protein